MKIPYVRTTQRYWDQAAARYDTDHPEHQVDALHPSWGLAHHREMDLRLIAPPYRGKLLVDVGCGQGHDLRGFAAMGMSAVGIDVSVEQLRRARPKPGAAYIQASASRLPLRAESADIVISDHGAFDHAPLELLVSEASRVLRPGGQLIVCTYHPLAFIAYGDSTRQLEEAMQRSYPSESVIAATSETVGFFSGAEAWVAALRRYGMSVDRIVEPITSEGASYYSELVPESWGARWPVDWIWCSTKSSKLE